jgi:hypothetical protein
VLLGAVLIYLILLLYRKSEFFYHFEYVSVLVVSSTIFSSVLVWGEVKFE